MLAVYNTICEEEVISRIKLDLGLSDTTEHDYYLEVLLREGLGSMDCISQQAKGQCDLQAEDNKLKLPKELTRFLALRPKTFKPTEEGEQPPIDGFPDACSRFIYADTAFLDDCNCNSRGFRQFNSGFQINKGFIHFNVDFQIEEATIAYLGLHLDKDGKAVIFERFERALTAYACWKFTRRWHKRYSQYIIESYEGEWVAQKGKMKGQDVQRHFTDNKLYIAEIMRAFLVSPVVQAP